METSLTDWQLVKQDLATAKGKKLILWIDGNDISTPLFVESFADSVSAEYLLIRCERADTALEFSATGEMGEYLPHIVMVIWSMIMAPAEAFTEAEKIESDFAYRGGAVLQRRLRKVLPNIPFVQFSVVSDPEVVRPYMTPPDYSFCAQDLLPGEFAERICEILGLPKQSKKQKTEDQILKGLFRLLLEWWNEEASADSGTAAYHHPAYRSIIALGRELGRPWQRRILRELERGPSHLCKALGEITAENPYPDPFPKEKVGDVAFLTDCWLAWGRKQGLIA